AGANQTQAKSHQSVRGKASAPIAPPTTSNGMRMRAWPRRARRSDAMGQTLGQTPREAGGEDLLRRSAMVVGHATNRDRPLVAIPDPVRCPRIVVARLPAAAAVHDIPPPVFQSQARLDEAGVLGPTGAERPDIRAMRVPHEAESRREIAEHLEAVFRRE